ncbi:hypothetical protein A2U01_0091117, partial [Trifolium medium]|nr:hypothetical protein [Trifolium medium]
DQEAIKKLWKEYDCVKVAVEEEKSYRITFEAHRDKVMADIARVGQQALWNAIDQFEVLNPNILLSLEGLDCYKIVVDIAFV